MERVMAKSARCLGPIIEKGDCVAVVKKISGWREDSAHRQVMSTKDDPSAFAQITLRNDECSCGSAEGVKPTAET